MTGLRMIASKDNFIILRTISPIPPSFAWRNCQRSWFRTLQLSLAAGAVVFLVLAAQAFNAGMERSLQQKR